MNILIVTHDLSIGGAQIFVVRLATALSKHKDVNVYLYDINPLMRNEQLLSNLPDSVKLITYHYKIPWYIKYGITKIHRLLYKFKLYKTFNKDATITINKFTQHRHFRTQLKKYNIQVINTHLWASDTFVANTIRKKSIPYIITMHGCYEALLYGSYDAHLQSVEPSDEFIQQSGAALEKAAAVLYIADKNLKIFSYIPATYTIKNLQKIYNGFQPTQLVYKFKEHLFEKDSMVFGIVSRAIPDKGWQQAIEAFISVTEQTGKKIYLILVGESEYMHVLKQQYSTKSNIIFTGFSLNPVEWINTFDVGLLPTYFPGESLPNSIIEYLYCGKPVIATKVGEISNMIYTENGNAGILIDLDQVTKKANLEQLTAAMLQYVNNHCVLHEHTQLAKQAFQKFNMDTCIENYKNVFEKVVYGAQSK